MKYDRIEILKQELKTVWERNPCVRCSKLSAKNMGLCNTQYCDHKEFWGEMKLIKRLNKTLGLGLKLKMKNESYTQKLNEAEKELEEIKDLFKKYQNKIDELHKWRKYL